MTSIGLAIGTKVVSKCDFGTYEVAGIQGEVIEASSYKVAVMFENQIGLIWVPVDSLEVKTDAAEGDDNVWV